MELKEVITQLKNVEQIYARADSLAKNYEYTSSNTQLAVILGYGSIKDNYYDDIFQKAQALKRSNDAKLRALGYNVQLPVDPNERLARRPPYSRAKGTPCCTHWSMILFDTSARR